MRKRAYRAALVVVLAVAAPAVNAAWLVLEDGSRVEARGGIERRGELLVFRLPSGTKVSIPVADVDFEASRRATQETERAVTRSAPSGLAAARVTAAGPSRLVLTDADVGHVSTPVASPAHDGTEDRATASGRERLVVSRWGEEDVEEGTRVFGVLRNRSSDAASAIQLTVEARDESGSAIQSAVADLDTTTLLPGQSTRFEALLSDLFMTARIEFAAKSVALKSGQSDQSAAE